MSVERLSETEPPGEPSIARPMVTPALLDRMCALLSLEVPETASETWMAETLPRHDAEWARVDVVDSLLANLGTKMQRSSAYGGYLASKLLGAQGRELPRIHAHQIPIPHQGWIKLKGVAARLLFMSPEHAEASRMENGISALSDAVATAIALLEKADVLEIDRIARGYRLRRTHPEPHYLDAIDAVKLICRKLQQIFPDVEFSVQISEHHSFRISVEWQGGPTDAEVSAIVNHFKGIESGHRLEDGFRIFYRTLHQALVLKDGTAIRFEGKEPSRGWAIGDTPDGAELVHFLVDSIITTRHEEAV